MKLNWVKQKMKAECYLADEEAIQVFIIKTGFKDSYIVTLDDAESVYIGDTKILNKIQIKEKYGIEIQI